MPSGDHSPRACPPALSPSQVLTPQQKAAEMHARALKSRLHVHSRECTPTRTHEGIRMRLAFTHTLVGKKQRTETHRTTSFSYNDNCTGPAGLYRVSEWSGTTRGEIRLELLVLYIPGGKTTTTFATLACLALYNLRHERQPRRARSVGAFIRYASHPSQVSPPAIKVQWAGTSRVQGL